MARWSNLATRGLGNRRQFADPGEYFMGLEGKFWTSGGGSQSRECRAISGGRSRLAKVIKIAQDIGFRRAANNCGGEL